MKAQMPPFFWPSATACSASGGLPGDSAPRISPPPPLGQAPDTERDIEPERAGRDRLDIHRTVVLAEPHHRSLAELALDLGQGCGQRLTLIHGGTFDDTQGWGGHWPNSLWRGFAWWTNS